MPGKGLIIPCGVGGGACGGGVNIFHHYDIFYLQITVFQLIWTYHGWGNDVGCPNADRPGPGGLVGWASLTRSSPDESDSLSDSEMQQLLNGVRLGCASVISFAGNQVSLNHIMGNFKVSVGFIPELVSLRSQFIFNEDHLSDLKV